MKKLLIIVSALALGALPVAAQSAASQAGSAAQSAGQSATDTTKGAAQSAGEATKSAAEDAGNAAKSGSESAANTATGKKIDINSASKDQLMKLGVGDDTSDKIIAARPFHSKHDLLSRNIVDQSTYDKISPKIVAHAPSSQPGAAAQPQK